jgi:CofD-related protein of GAK system
MPAPDTRPHALVPLVHTTLLPRDERVRHWAQHAADGPAMVLFTGGRGAHALSKALIRYTHNTAHILPVFDDGGSSRALRSAFGMPPPGDLRNRMMALADRTLPASAEIVRLFQHRLADENAGAALRGELEALLCAAHPLVAAVPPGPRETILAHLRRCAARMPPDFDLRRGNVGNFVVAGAYLAAGDLAAVLAEVSNLSSVRGSVLPVCNGGRYHLCAALADGTKLLGQSRISTQPHAAVGELEIVEPGDEGAWCPAMPQLNPRAARAIADAASVTYAMGSVYTSLVPSLLVSGVGRAIRAACCPTVFVANLVRDCETPGMTASETLEVVLRSLRRSDPQPGAVSDYVHYALVSDHGDSDSDGRIPVDLARIRALGVQPIVLPLEARRGIHDPELVAATLLSLC